MINTVKSSICSSKILPEIILEHPEKTWLPGEKVTGNVVFEVKEPMDARFIKLEYGGYATTTGILLCGLPFNYQYFRGEKILWTTEDGGLNQLPPGKYKFTFSFRLPNNIMPSFESHWQGNIRYCIHLIIARPWHLHKVICKRILVTNKTDFAVTRPIYLRPSEYTVSADVGLCLNRGLVEMKISYPKRLIKPSETLSLTVKLTNNSSLSLTELSIRLIEQSHYHARPQLTPCRKYHLCPLPASQRGNHEKDLVVNLQNINLPPKSSDTIETEIKVPENCTPSFESPLITVQYAVLVTVSTKYWGVMHSEIPVYMANEEIVELKKEDPPPYSD